MPMMQFILTGQDINKVVSQAQDIAGLEAIYHNIKNHCVRSCHFAHICIICYKFTYLYLHGPCDRDLQLHDLCARRHPGRGEANDSINRYVI